MELAKCVRCGKLFTQVKLAVCHSCELEEEKEILKVHVYMRDHPGETLEDVSNSLNVYLEDIERWIDERRLTLVSIGGICRNCLICGTRIVTGRICGRCSEDLGLKPNPANGPRNPTRDIPPGLRNHDIEPFSSARKYRRD